MKILTKPNRNIVDILSTQIIEPGVSYVKSPYLINYKNAVFNTLTMEAILVEDEKKENDELIRRWFYIPEYVDAGTISHFVRQRQLLTFMGPGSNKKVLYTIFTTTACNADCTYCFEKGCEVLTMTPDIATDVASYIIRTMDDRSAIHLKWFGGEPLFNKEAINIISDKLNESNVNFVAGIITNGDLLGNCSDEELKRWKIKTVQLTLDDIGDGYSTIKGLDNEAYERLKQSIERLGCLGIRINIRIHLNATTGIEPCIRVVEDLKDFKNVIMYPRLIYGEKSVENFKDIFKIKDKIVEVGKGQYNLPTYSSLTHCMADNSKMATITPIGELSPCEHYAYGEHIYGSIYSKDRNEDILKKWSVREKYVTPDCKDCPLYPSCRKLIMCPAEGKCSEGYQYYQIETIKRALRKKVEEINGRDSNTDN